jgi:hypothetical protein
MADVEMKSAADAKPADEEKKVEVKVEEPTDQYYGKYSSLPLLLSAFCPV